jgi:hypothetical protein
MRLYPYLLGATFVMAAASAVAQAQAPAAGATYRCVDDAGRSTYTNVREEMAGKKCTVVSREVSVVPAPPASTPVSAGGSRPPAARASSDSASGGSGASRVDSSTQRSRDGDRKRILEQELQSAEKQLAEARKKLSEQESIRNGDERNYQRVLDRLKPFQDDVRIAEDNVSALNKELSNIR